ncbi:putative DD41D transposase [Trichonephila clavipes]|nr:putative DD41D transposase [Trichonephila clavipes]
MNETLSNAPSHLKATLLLHAAPHVITPTTFDTMRTPYSPKERDEIYKDKEADRYDPETYVTKEFELERMKLSNSTDTISVSSTDLEGQGVNRRVNLRDLVPKFDAKNADINLFFEIFERQTKKEKVAEDRWVSQLIPLLPIEIAEIVAKEPLKKSDDYAHIKNLLLDRFQLTPRALRDRFVSHQRRPGAMWADLVFELREKEANEEELELTDPRPREGKTIVLSFLLLKEKGGRVSKDNLVALHFKYDQARRIFVEWAQNEIAVVPDFHKRNLFSNEVHFWLNGYVNKQNCHIWSEANSQVYVETPLHPKKLTVWCALWADGIIGPYFFKNDEGHNLTVNGDQYRAMITNFFIPELNNHDVQELWFQQDGTTCHAARATIDLLKDTFGDRLISRFGPVNWPPRSCDLTPLDYFCGAM